MTTESFVLFLFICLCPLTELIITKNLYISSTLIQIVLKIYQTSCPRNSESDLMEGTDIHTVFKALQVILKHGQEGEPGSSLFGLILTSLFDTAYRTV